MSDVQTADSVRAVPEIHRKAIIVDGHCDTPYRLKRKGLTLSDPDPNAQVDLQRLRESGITASFFVSYVPPFYAGRGAANFARQLLDLIHREVAAHQDLLVFVADSASIRKAKRDGKVGILIGVEGGHAIENSLEILREFYQRGARYLTLTHINTNNWADSSGDVARHNGLTDFGRDVVRTMNDLGMMVDISHVSDKTFYDALETSRAPIFASHSSCRAIAGHPRNLTDPMLRDLAGRRGLCMINFYTAFVSDRVAKTMAKAQKRTRKDRDADLTANEELPDDHRDWEEFVDWYESLNAPKSTIEEVIDHIVHAATVAGVDAVGIGSDFDGVPALPEGITDISLLPALTQRLIDRKFRDDEILKILGENFLRVFAEVEKSRTRENL